MMHRVEIGSTIAASVTLPANGGLTDFLLTEVDISTSIALSVNSLFLSASDCLLILRDQDDQLCCVDMWKPLMESYACQIHALGIDAFTSTIHSDLVARFPPSNKSEDGFKPDDIESMGRLLFEHASATHHSRTHVPLPMGIPYHWMEFTIAPLLLAPVSVNDILTHYDESLEVIKLPLLLRFRSQPTELNIHSNSCTSNPEGIVCVTNHGSSYSRVLKELRQIRRSLGPMGALQRSILVPMFEGVYDLVENSRTTATSRSDGTGHKFEE